MTARDSDNAATAPEGARPVLRVVRGDPSAEDLAVLTALMSAAGSGDEPSAPAPRGGWADPARRVRARLQPGAGAWRASLLR